MATLDQIASECEQLGNELKNIKASTRRIKARRQALMSQSQVAGGNSLSHNLKKVLPQHLMPTNIGHINVAKWPFYYSVEFDLTTTNDWPNLTSNTKVVSSFQVSQEAAFLFTGITRHANDADQSGDDGMFNLEFRDRQSSRFFNEEPIPLQMVGIKGYQTVLPTPFLVMPNAFFEVTLATHIADGVSIASSGNAEGKHTLTFWGYRMRIEDAQKVLSTAYKG